MGASFEYSGKKYRVDGIVHGNRGIVAHVTMENPFTPGRVYTSEYISVNGNAFSGDAVFVGDQGQVLRRIAEGDRWENTGVPGKGPLVGQVVDGWLCVYANGERMSSYGDGVTVWQVGDVVASVEDYRSLLDGTIVLNSCSGPDRDAVIKDGPSSYVIGGTEGIAHEDVWDRFQPPFTIVHIPDHDA